MLSAPSSAGLVDACSQARVNILSVQIFPHLGQVTDELLLDLPAEWDAGQLTSLVEDSGGDAVAVSRSSERDLVDVPTTYLRHALELLERPHALTEALTDLLDIDAWAASGTANDVLIVEIGASVVELRRAVLHRERTGARRCARRVLPLRSGGRHRGCALRGKLSIARVEGDERGGPFGHSGAHPESAHRGDCAPCADSGTFGVCPTSECERRNSSSHLARKLPPGMNGSSGPPDR